MTGRIPRNTHLIAILRGITPDEAVPVAELLFEEGFRIVEIPLNSPDPLKSIEQVARALGTKMVVGAGTVVDVEDVTRVTNIGGKLIVSPNFDSDVVRTAKTAGLYCCPGVQTVTEAFAAHRAGADALKLFPADVSPPAVVKAIRTVLPKEVKLVPVGGVDEQLMGDYWSAGAKGFGWAVLHQSPDKRGVPLPVKMVSQLTQTWHSQVRSFC